MERRQEPAQAGSSTPRRALLGLVAILIVVATFIAYLPASRGGFIWDDDGHVTKPALRSLEGLGRIWFEVGASQQYYPLLHSAFWIQYRLWGDWTPGYHAVNIALHALNAAMVLFILRRLLRDRAAPWADWAAALGAAVFALHPVHAESVAWITELKNTLSGFFYLTAMLAYLHFDAERRRRWYALALALFVCGLLTKTVTATLPAALLVIFWWQRGRLEWKRDVRPLALWFVLGAAGGLFTAWVEHHIIGAKGSAFELTLIERGLLAGRVVWFYLGKLFWPSDLIFIYPRWPIDAGSWTAWLYPCALAALLLAALMLARRSRAPLAALLFFAGSLFPVLGFFNVYPFLFSYVADHFQYLPSLGIIALASAGMAAAAWRIPSPAARAALLVAVPVALGVLTFRQSAMYADGQTLYETTIRRNPVCWMAHNNLGVLFKDRGENVVAIEHFRRALDVRPAYPEAWNNLGVAHGALGRHDEAIAAYRRSLSVRERNPQALGNLATSLSAVGRHDEAIAAFGEAIRYLPDDPGLYRNLGIALHTAGRRAEAIVEYERSLALDPNQPAVREQIELARAAMKSPTDATAALERLVAANPGNFQTRFDLGVALAQAGRLEEAVAQYKQVVAARPDHVEALNNLGSTLLRLGRPAEAVPHLEQAARLLPRHIPVRMNLAMALAAAGREQDAVAAAREALALARATGDAALAQRIEAWIGERRVGGDAPQP